jgi:hypothetical protein
MAVLGILTCEILELEFAHILITDADLAGITVLDDEHSLRLLEALESLEVKHLKRITDLNEFRPRPPNRTEVLVQVLELALHNRKLTLQQGLIEAACKLGPHVDALMLGYGLCGNALEKPDELLSDAGVPVFIPMDEDHPVDDCVGLLIGGRECYYKEQCKIAGTFFMIPGWTHHWRRMVEHEFGSRDLDLLKRLFKDYERSLVIPTPTMSEREMKRNTEAFDRLFGLRSEVREGTLKILYEAWYSAKAFLNSHAKTS